MNGINKFSLFPPVIKSLLITNVVVFIIHHVFLSLFHFGEVSLEYVFIKLFYLFPVGGESLFRVWQLITYQFIHANIGHIFFNLFALWMFGAELETLWGSKKFLTFYLLCGIGAGLTQLYIAPFFSPPAPAIGASGSVFGILVAFAMSFPNRPIFMFPFFIPIPAKYFVFIFAGISLLSGGENVAHFAHLGGAASGFLLFKFGDRIGLYRFIENLLKKKQSYVFNNPGYSSNVFPIQDKPIWQKTYDEPIYKSPGLSVDGEDISQTQIDRILDKISATGYQNLTDKEKKILFELSQKLR